MNKLVFILYIFLMSGCAASKIYVDTDEVNGLGVEVSFPQGKVIPITVKAVISGNTIELTNNEVVSYIGVHIPNLYNIPDKARSLNEELIANNEIRLEFDNKKRDSENRLLAYAYTTKGLFINAEILREGLGKALINPPNLLHSEILLRAEEEARKASRGVWSEDFKS